MSPINRKDHSASLLTNQGSRQGRNIPDHPEDLPPDTEELPDIPRWASGMPMLARPGVDLSKEPTQFFPATPGSNELPDIPRWPGGMPTLNRPDMEPPTGSRESGKVENLSLFENGPEAFIGENKPSIEKVRGLFKLTGGVGPNEDNIPDDSTKVRNLLALLGQTDFDTHPGDSQEIEKAVRRFQSANGIEVDGILQPGGETIKAVEAAVKEAAAPFYVEGPNPLSFLPYQPEAEFIEEQQGMHREQEDLNWLEAIARWISLLLNSIRGVGLPPPAAIITLT